jgi:transketolase
MLNPELKLNSNIFTKPDLAATRDGFGDAINMLGISQPDVVVLTADVGKSVRITEFKKKHPERFVECGVAEQNMIAIAAGIAVSGKIPFACSYAIFSPGKNWETFRTAVIYNKANVKVAGHHSGLATGGNGVSHQATEDISLTRCLPDITVLCPCDAIEAKKVTIASTFINGPVYLRFSREPMPTITTEDTPYDPTKAYVYWQSDNPTCSIFATGYMLYYALLAAHELAQENIAVEVIDVVNIKPLDKKAILERIKKTGCAVTVEDHQIAGGMGSALAELFAKNHPIPVEFIGLKNTFGESGDVRSLLKKYNMDQDAIKHAVRKVLGRNSS